MKKFFKGLFITLTVLVLLCVAVAVTGYILVSEDARSGFVYDIDGDDFPTVVGKSLDKSIEEIKGSNYATNRIDVAFTMKDINNLIVSQIQSSFAPNYLNGQDYIIEAEGFRVESIYASAATDSIEIVACGSYRNFINTAVHANATVTLDGAEKILIQLNSARVGKYLNFGKDVLAKVFGLLPAFEGFDAQNLVFTYNFGEMLESSITDPIAQDLLHSLSYSAVVENSNLVLRMDSSSLFTGERTCPSYGEGETNAKFTAAATALVLDPTSTQNIVLTESEFNNLVMGDLNSELATFQTSIPVNTQYTFPANLGEPYYSIATNSVSASFGITSVTNSVTASSSGTFATNLAKNMDASGDLSSVTLTVASATIGTARFASIEGFDFVFDISGNTLLAGYPLHIKDVVLNQVDSTATLVVAAA